MIIYIIDNSPSMLKPLPTGRHSAHLAPTRLEAAKALVLADLTNREDTSRRVFLCTSDGNDGLDAHSKDTLRIRNWTQQLAPSTRPPRGDLPEEVYFRLRAFDSYRDVEAVILSDNLERMRSLTEGMRHASFLNSSPSRVDVRRILIGELISRGKDNDSDSLLIINTADDLLHAQRSPTRAPSVIDFIPDRKEPRDVYSARGQTLRNFRIGPSLDAPPPPAAPEPDRTPVGPDGYPGHLDLPASSDTKPFYRWTGNRLVGFPLGTLALAFALLAIIGYQLLPRAHEPAAAPPLALLSTPAGPATNAAREPLKWVLNPYEGAVSYRIEKKTPSGSIETVTGGAMPTTDPRPITLDPSTTSDNQVQYRLVLITASKKEIAEPWRGRVHFAPKILSIPTTTLPTR